jgi:DNA repair exonuclease SbcCD nuclease subunit
MADTHLGYRARKGTINKWAIPNYSKPFEQEMYDTFLKVIENVSKIEDLDYLVHCGDMFHVPSAYSSYPPPEPARRVLKEGLDLFFKNTKNEVPFIYIEGNHGVFRGYEYTPFESHISKENYPNLYYFKERDLIEAIKSNQPLQIEIKEKKVRFYLFPYFEFKGHEIYKEAYNNWIINQKPPENDEFINIALAHGKITKEYDTGEVIHKKIRSDDYNYDYVALGHEHGLKKVSNKRYFSGSLLPMNFKERLESQGYLITTIDPKTKQLDVKKVFTEKLLKRIFKIIDINVSPQNSSAELLEMINRELETHISDEGFDPHTAARLKIRFEGEMTFERVWLINDIMTKVRRECFSQTETYNILQLIWQMSDISDRKEDDVSPGIIEDYILKKPDEDFKNFVDEKLTDDRTKFNVEKLTQYGIEAIKSALDIMEKEEEV